MARFGFVICSPARHLPTTGRDWHGAWWSVARTTESLACATDVGLDSKVACGAFQVTRAPQVACPQVDQEVRCSTNHGS